MQQIVLTALADTARPHGLLLCRQEAGKRLRPGLAKPIFLAPSSIRLTEAVAVVYRDNTKQQKPIDGALIGITANGPVRLKLVDAERGIDTDDDPAWIAFGLNMSIGKLVVRQGETDRVLPWSIIDLSSTRRQVDAPTPARIAARDAFFAMLSQLASSGAH